MSSAHSVPDVADGDTELWVTKTGSKFHHELCRYITKTEGKKGADGKRPKKAFTRPLPVDEDTYKSKPKKQCDTCRDAAMEMFC